MGVMRSGLDFPAIELVVELAIGEFHFPPLARRGATDNLDGVRARLNWIKGEKGTV
jgi:hypothetical protein